MLVSNGNNFWSHVSRFIRWLVILAAFIGTFSSQTLAEINPQAPAKQIPFEQAVHDTLEWSTGNSSSTELNKLYDKIELSSFRYGIEPEFSICVIAVENLLYPEISWVRYESWAYIERTTGNKHESFPRISSDLDTALSELRGIMKAHDKTKASYVEDVLRDYWSGSKGEFNASTIDYFVETVSTLFLHEIGFQSYLIQRRNNHERSKYGSTRAQPPEPRSAWEGLAVGDMEGYRSQIGSMPKLAEDLKSFPGFEEDYAAIIRTYNKNLSQNEAIVISRAILSYCEQTKFLVDPRFVVALVRAESAFRPDAVSKVGALGLGQLMPATAKSHGIRDAFDPIQNLYGCVKYLEREMNRWGDNDDWLALVAASYNAGPGAVMKYNGVPPYKETKNFVTTVRRYYEEVTRSKSQ